ncbi:MAG: GNAT family N-acetyltransferase [Pseudomonadota bacterium]
MVESEKIEQLERPGIDGGALKKIAQTGSLQSNPVHRTQNHVTPVKTDFGVPMVLSTKRLTLRAPHRRDLDDLVALANDVAVSNNLGTMPYPYRREDGLHFIDHLSVPGPQRRMFAITDRYSDRFMGGCGYRPIEEHPDRLGIGYWLGKAYWGQGLAAEAAQALIDHAFTSEDIGEIWATVRIANHQSKRVIEKCGFQFVHNGMSRSLALGGMVPIDYYCMSRKTWESLHAWGER